LNPDNDTTAPVGVFGLGNVLMGDDALGPTVIAHLLAGYEFPDGVHLEDLGTPGLDMHPHLAGRQAIILIDVVKSAGDPGELRLYRRDEILRHAPGVRVSPHDPGVKEALLALQFADDEPEILLVGVIPDKIEHATSMTVTVRAAVTPAIAAVLAELERLDVPAVRRAAPGHPDLWWEAAGDDRG
jgi:hydrogenase maturation protease